MWSAPLNSQPTQVGSSTTWTVSRHSANWAATVGCGLRARNSSVT